MHLAPGRNFIDLNVFIGTRFCSTELSTIRYLEPDALQERCSSLVWVFLFAHDIGNTIVDLSSELSY